MKTYCSSCGHPNAYTAKKPKFCNECGKSMEITEGKSAPVKKNPLQESFVEDEIIEDVVPSLQGLDIEIESNKVVGVKLEELVDSAAGPPPEQPIERPLKEGRPKRLTKKAKQELWDNWQKEAGTMRKK